MWEGFQLLLSFKGIIHLLIGGSIGLAIGILPGLGPVFGTVLLLPFTFWMSPAMALIFLGSLYACCVYGGSITAVLLGIPGTVGSVSTVFDGYELSKQGKAGMALGLSATSSMLGGIVGVISLALFAPKLAEFALKFSPADYLALAIFGLSMVAVAAKGDTLKGLMIGALGVLISTIGVDLITGNDRFTFGWLYLEGGVPFVPAMVGLFALSQAFILAEQGGKISKVGRVTSGVREGVKTTFKHPLVLGKNALLGSVLGAIPGVGINITNFLAYLFEKRASRDPDSFGKGNPLGVVAPETANNAVVSSSLIPAFALGIPGGSEAALFIAAVAMHGLRPGYAFFSEGGPVAWALVGGLLSAQFLFFFIGMFGANIFAKVTLVPSALLVPVVVMLSFVGGIADRHLFMDSFMVLFFGVIGYILSRYRYPTACLVLGMILGPLVERNFSRALQMSKGEYGILFSSGISQVLWIVTILVVLWGIIPVKELLERRKAKSES